MKASQQQIEKSGSRSVHHVYGVSREALKSATGGQAQITDIEGGYKVRVSNKRERAALIEAVESASATAKPTAPERGKWARRYVERADIAEQQGHSHGKCWYCAELDIQTKGAHPSWEGDLICYVYE